YFTIRGQKSSLQSVFFKSSRQGQFKPLQNDPLMSIRRLHASQPYLCAVSGRQNHIRKFDLCEFPLNFPRLVPEACILAKSTQGLPKDIGQETDQNMRLNSSFLLMPYRANTQIAFVDTESILCLGQLNVCFP